MKVPPVMSSCHETFLQRSCLQQLEAGAACLHPAGGLWGLTFDPLKLASWRLLYRIKRRSEGKKFLFLVSRAEVAFRYWKPLPASWRAALTALWPGPLSVIAPLHSPPFFHLPGVDVGFRVPRISDSWFQGVLRHFPRPLPTTSVNVSGGASLKKEKDLLEFAEQHGVWAPRSDAGGRGEGLQGYCEAGHAVGSYSSIISVVGAHHYRVVREGHYSACELQRILGAFDLQAS